MPFEAGRLYINQDGFIPCSYLETAVIFQETLEIINKLSKVFKLVVAAGNQRESAALVLRLGFIVSAFCLYIVLSMTTVGPALSGSCVIISGFFLRLNMVLHFAGLRL